MFAGTSVYDNTPTGYDAKVMIYDYTTITCLFTLCKTGCAYSCLTWCFTDSAVRFLLYSEVIGCEASIVNVENQASIVGSGIKHLEQEQKTYLDFKLDLGTCTEQTNGWGKHLHQRADKTLCFYKL